MGKTCFRCGLTLPRSSFYRHRFMADGLLGKCKQCTRRDVTEHRLKNLERVRAYDRLRSKTKNRREQNARKHKRFRVQRPEMAASYLAVRKALRAGFISKPTRCESCHAAGVRICAHHDDHHQQLAIMWLCAPCHAARHRFLGRLGKRVDF